MRSWWLFNVGAEIYAWFTAQAAWRASCARLATRVGNAESIVDLGCGPGVSTFELARALPKATLIGVDIAARMLNEARRREGAKRIAWLRGDSACVPLASHSVDACTGHSFLYLVADRRATLAEIRRVLRPGGRLVLMEPNAQRATIRQTLAVSRDPRHLVSITLWRPFSQFHGRFSTDSLRGTLARAGFVDIQIEETLGGLGLLATAHNPW